MPECETTLWQTFGQPIVLVLVTSFLTYRLRPLIEGKIQWEKYYELTGIEPNFGFVKDAHNQWQRKKDGLYLATVRNVHTASGLLEPYEEQGHKYLRDRWFRKVYRREGVNKSYYMYNPEDVGKLPQVYDAQKDKYVNDPRYD